MPELCWHRPNPSKSKNRDKPGEEQRTELCSQHHPDSAGCSRGKREKDGDKRLRNPCQDWDLLPTHLSFNTKQESRFIKTGLFSEPEFRQPFW